MNVDLCLKFNWLCHFVNDEFVVFRVLYAYYFVYAYACWWKHLDNMYVIRVTICSLCVNSSLCVCIILCLGVEQGDEDPAIDMCTKR